MQDVISAMHVTFEGEMLLTQYCVENKRLNAYFSKYKVWIEVDEYDHEDTNSNYEESRQFMIESHEITVIRTNPYDADFVIKRLINQIYMRIAKSIKKQTKKSNKKNERTRRQNKIKELEDEIKNLKLQLTNQSVWNELSKNVLSYYKKWGTHNQK